jgi:hypothetical protein
MKRDIVRKSPIRNPRLHYYMLVYGISCSAIQRLGGTKHLDSIPDDARNVLINQWRRYKENRNNSAGNMLDKPIDVEVAA